MEHFGDKFVVAAYFVPLAVGIVVERGARRTVVEAQRDRFAALMVSADFELALVGLDASMVHKLH